MFTDMMLSVSSQAQEGMVLERVDRVLVLGVGWLGVGATSVLGCISGGW